MEIEKPQIKIQILKEGDKKRFPKIGNTLTVHYTGYHFVDEKKKKNQEEKEKKEEKPPNVKKIFDSSVQRDDPYKFMFGAGIVLQGFEECVAKMSCGQKAIVTCPPEKAFGTNGVKHIIKANETVYFEIELIKIEE